MEHFAWKLWEVFSNIAMLDMLISHQRSRRLISNFKEAGHSSEVSPVCPHKDAFYIDKLGSKQFNAFTFSNFFHFGRFHL